MSNALLTRIADQPAMFASEMGGQLKALLESAAAHPDFARLMGEAAQVDDGFWPEPSSWKAAYRPYVVQDGVLQIPVQGYLMDRFAFATGWSTGYEYIWRAFDRGLADGNVRGIALMVNSGGGLVSGNFELVDKIVAHRGEKPVRAFVQDVAASAAYNIASAADRLLMSQTSIVGSIGVRMTHVDWSKFNERMGLTYTILFETEGKADGDPDLPLSAEAKARYQARLQDLYSIFVSSVARNRGLDEGVIRYGIKSFTYGATEAVSNGLADEVGTLDDAVAAFAADLSTSEGDTEMSTQGNPAAIDQAAHEQAVSAAREEGRTAGVAEGQQAGIAEAEASERTRVSALVEIDAGSKISPELAKAIAEGTSAGDFAIAQAKAAKGKASAALSGAQNEAVSELPEGSSSADGTGQQKVNRGEAAVARNRGKIPGLPKEG